MSGRYFSQTSMTAQQASAEVLYNDLLALYDCLLTRTAVSATTTAEPAFVEEAVYILPASPTGTHWGVGSNGLKITAGINGTWKFFAPSDGWQFFAQDTNTWWTYDGTNNAWISTRAGSGSVQTGITAHAGGGQGSAVALTAETCVIATCASANDSVVLPSAQAGLSVFVANQGAQTAAVFPLSGDTIDNGAANASVTIATNKARLFRCVSGTAWYSLLSA